MNRDEAWALVCEKVASEPMRNHMLACEACMRALAARLGEDVETWGLTGLVHDLDIEEVDADPERHGHVGAALLTERGLPQDVVHAVEVHPGHGGPEARASVLDKALWAVDPTSGFLSSAVLVVPGKRYADLKVKSVKKRMKDKRFSAAVDRDQIRSCADLGLELTEFIELCLGALQRHEAAS